jgi:hypothetical protein
MGDIKLSDAAAGGAEEYFVDLETVLKWSSYTRASLNSILIHDLKR